MKVVFALSLLASLPAACVAFSPPTPPQWARRGSDTMPTARWSSSVESASSEVLSVSLPKPLGVVLEENEQGAAAGVFVLEVGDAGSAAAIRADILGCKLLSVQGADTTTFGFDDVMEAIVGAPDTVDLVFEAKKQVIDYEVGTVVTIVAQQGDGKDDLTFDAKVGDNLRMALIENGFEVYQGMKQKLGNCGGGGTCTFCAMEFVESQGWEERSDYETTKLGKNPNARLVCLNPIQGPVTLRKMNR